MEFMYFILARLNLKQQQAKELSVSKYKRNIGFALLDFIG